MKFLTVCFLALMFFSGASAQLLSSAPKEVEVLAWQEGTVGVTPDFWDDKEYDVLKQISKEEFEQVKKFGWLRGVPASMSYYTQIFEKKVPEADFLKKMESLHIYRIATFLLDVKDGKKRYKAILKVPYAGNESWDSTIKWDVVYFLIPVEHLKEK